MSRARARLALAVLVLALGGCVPQKLLVWSPDGKKAAVIGGDGLYLADEAGTLSTRLIPGAAAAAWLPDSSRLVVEVVRPKARWRDLEPYVGDAEKRQIAGAAEQFVRESMASREPLAVLVERIRAMAPYEKTCFDDELATLLYLRDTQGPRLRERFGQEWKALQEAAVAMSIVQVFDVSGNRAKPGPVLGATFSDINDIRPSPDGSVVAYVTDDFGSAGTCRLFVAPVDGSRASALVADLTARYPDWSADGRSLVYARANGPREGPQDTLRLGSLRRLRITDDSGKLLSTLPADRECKVAQSGEAPEPDSARAPAAEVLAGFVFSGWTKVRCLNDGRIVFSGAEITLPATAEDMPSHLSLFSVEPGRRPTVARLIPRRAEGEIAEVVHQFELSPNQTRVAIPGAGGRVTVLSLTSGEVKEVRPRKGDAVVRMVPTWKDDDELTFAVANEGAVEKRRAGEFCAWSHRGVRTLSAAWPDSVVASLRPSEEKKPPAPVGRR